MRTFALCFAILLAYVSAQSCDYYSTSGDSYYLGGLGWESNHWMNFTDDASSSVWYFRVCEDSESDNEFVNPCPAGSAVCVSVKGGAFVSRGSLDSVLMSDSPYGSSEGVEEVFGSADVCEDNSAIKTVIDYVCGDSFDPIVTISLVDGCFTTITVNTTQACSSDVEDGDMDDWVEDDMDSEEVHPHIFISFSGLVLMIAMCICMCCCCCLAKRRRCQRKKDIAMKQFSNVAFQPIPQTRTQSNVVPQMNLPAYNPYVVQPQQFVYYYPTQVPQQQASFVPLEQVNSDEKFAKDLQAQFDNENRV